MNSTAINPISILARGVKGAAGTKRAGILHHALCHCDGASLVVTATDLEACGVVSIPAPADFPAGASIVSTAKGEPVPDRSPGDYPAVGSLDGAILATIHTTFGEVARIAAHIVPAIDTEGSRYALGGILLDCEAGGGPAYAVGTDGRRMHIARFATHATAAATAIVSPRLFTGILAAARAAARATGRKGPAAGDSVTLTISTQGVEAAWYDDLAGALAKVVARRIEGRFPEWRRVAEEDARATGHTLHAGDLSPWCAEVVRATAAEARRAGDVAVAALPAGAPTHKRTSARGAAVAAHPHGVRLDGTTATGRGCSLSMPLGATPLPWPAIMLDARYLGEALAGAAAWNGSPGVTIRATDGRSAARIPGGAWDAGCGAGFLAVVMPLAQD